MMSEMDVNAIAGTLKLYFRELPEPLFTDELYPNFAGGISEFHLKCLIHVVLLKDNGKGQRKEFPSVQNNEDIFNFDLMKMMNVLSVQLCLTA